MALRSDEESVRFFCQISIMMTKVYDYYKYNYLHIDSFNSCCILTAVFNSCYSFLTAVTCKKWVYQSVLMGLTRRGDRRQREEEAHVDHAILCPHNLKIIAAGQARSLISFVRISRIHVQGLFRAEVHSDSSLRSLNSLSPPLPFRFPTACTRLRNVTRQRNLPSKEDARR